MALNFPTSPVNDQVYDNYIYNSTLGVWKVNWSLPTQLGTVTVGTWNANPIAIAYGGTGATDVATARANLGLAGLSGIQTFTGTNTFSPTINSAVSLIVKGLSGQTANLQEWQNSSGTVLAKVEPSGNISGKGIIAYDYSQSIAGTAATVPSVVRGAASQTADLQQWQNSLGTILSRVDANGNVFASTFTGNLNGYVGPSNNGRVGNVDFASITSQAQWSSLPVGFGSMLNLTSSGLPSAGAFHFFHKVANRDVGGGWGGISLDYTTGDLYVGLAADNTVYATWKKVALQSQAQTFTGQQTLSLITPAGTTTVPPIDMTPGTNLTTPLAGAVEFDGTAFYATTNSGRGAIATPQFSIGTNTFISTTAAQNLFPAANDTLTVAGGTTYLLEMQVYINVPAASSVAHTATLTLSGGGATFTAIDVEVFAQDSATGSATFGGTPRQYRISSAGAGAIWTTASTVGVASSRFATVRGIVRVNAGGTFIPQFTTSVATVAVPVGSPSSYITMTPIGPNTAAFVGPWS